MSEIQELRKNLTISALNSSTIIINGEEYKINLEKVIQKQIIPLSFILEFEPNSSHKAKDIEAYSNYYMGSKKYKRFIFLIACLYIFKQSATKEKEKEAKKLMLSFFNVDDITAFSLTLKEFKNLLESKTLKNVSKQVEDVCIAYSDFEELVLFKIIKFAYYHSFDFEIEIDIAVEFNYLDIMEMPADAPF